MKHKKFIKYLAIFIVLIFLFSYFLETSGYYEYNLQNKKNLTDAQIEKFESDIKAGKDIDLNSYLESTTIDYSNSLTRTTSEANIRLNAYLKKFITGSFDILGKFIK
ncbi:MAG: hypothetical protein IJ509_03690 [Bacilli bacterium]|nr:hypothetical protein [Bacilli bacterium]